MVCSSGASSHRLGKEPQQAAHERDASWRVFSRAGALCKIVKMLQCGCDAARGKVKSARRAAVKEHQTVGRKKPRGSTDHSDQDVSRTACIATWAGEVQCETWYADSTSGETGGKKNKALPQSQPRSSG
eukprot:1847746-Pleurochrysis_carterae.AAC.2